MLLQPQPFKKINSISAIVCVRCGMLRGLRLYDGTSGRIPDGARKGASFCAAGGGMPVSSVSAAAMSMEDDMRSYLG